ncbi:MAG: type II toxin-antitoxin system VapC family toxin [Alphaproteobacteria bacterium]
MGYIVDTNVLSELMKVKVDENVKKWFQSIDMDQICLTSVTIEEITYGLLAMPKSKRQTQLSKSFSILLGSICVLDFGLVAAAHCAKLRFERKTAGRPISYADAQIAGVTRQHNMILVTRNIKDFTGINIQLLNPFETN